MKAFVEKKARHTKRTRQTLWVRRISRGRCCTEWNKEGKFWLPHKGRKLEESQNVAVILSLHHEPDWNFPLKACERDYSGRTRICQHVRGRRVQRKSQRALWSPHHNRTPIFNFLLRSPSRLCFVWGAVKRES